MSKINVCITCDGNYSKYACITIASILKNSKHEDDLQISVISSDITEESKQKIKNLSVIKKFDIEFIIPSKNLFEEYTNTKTIDRLPLASFYRLKLPTLLKNKDKVIYLDCDTIVQTNLSDMYNTDITNYYCGGIKDIDYKKLGTDLGLKSENIYINSGVLLFNLKKMREDNAEEMLSNFAKEHPEKLSLGDQDLINICFENKILILDDKWNVQIIDYFTRSCYSKEIKIIHYMGASKPWKFASYMPLKKHYYNYAKLTEWDTPNKFWHIKSEFAGIFKYLIKHPLFIFSKEFFKSFNLVR